MKISLLILASLFIESLCRRFDDASRAERRSPCRVLLLDLDETLVLSTEVGGVINGFTVRDHTEYFLAKAKEVFSHVFILSSGTQPYVEAVIRKLPGRKYIDDIYGRKFNTKATQGALHQKDLRIFLPWLFGHRLGYRKPMCSPDTSRSVLIDNSPCYMDGQEDRVLIVKSFTGEQDDELLHLADAMVAFVRHNCVVESTLFSHKHFKDWSLKQMQGLIETRGGAKCRTLHEFRKPMLVLLDWDSFIIGGKNHERDMTARRKLPKTIRALRKIAGYVVLYSRSALTLPLAQQEQLTAQMDLDGIYDSLEHDLLQKDRICDLVFGKFGDLEKLCPRRILYLDSHLPSNVDNPDIPPYATPILHVPRFQSPDDPSQKSEISLGLNNLLSQIQQHHGRTSVVV